MKLLQLVGIMRILCMFFLAFFTTAITKIIHAQDQQASTATISDQAPSLAETLSQAQQATSSLQQSLLTTAQKLTFLAVPEFPTPNFNLATAQAYPTTSLNSAAVDQLFGPSGLNVSTQILGFIKSFYFYLEYCTRRQRAAQLLTAAENYAISYEDILPNGGWAALITAITTASKSETLDYARITVSASAWAELDAALMLTFESEQKSLDDYWSELPSTSFWTGIPLTTQDLQNSSFWQDFIKTIITKSFNLDTNLLDARHQSELLLFRYIPYLETAYYTPDFTAQRYTTELTQLALLINEHTRLNMLAQSTDWGTLLTAAKAPKSSAIKNYDYARIIASAVTFSQSEFYTTLESISNPQAGDTNSPFVQNSDGTYTFKQITLAPPYKQEFLLFGMALTLQTLLTPLYNLTGLAKTTTALTSIKIRPVPSILPYDSNELVYLEDLNSISQELQLAAQQSAGISNSASTLVDQQQIQTQSFTDWVEQLGGRIASDFENLGEAIYAGAKDLWDIVKDEGEVLYYQSGLATLIQHVPPQQAEELARTYKDATTQDFVNFGNDVKNIVTDALDLGSTIVSSPVDLALYGIGQVLNDPSLSTDYESMLESVADALGDVAGGLVTITGNATMRLTTDAVMLIAHTIVTVATGGMVGGQQWIDDWKQMGYDIVSAILETIVVGINTIKSAISDIIKAIGYLIKLLTDSIIDVGSALAAVANPYAWLNGDGTSFSDYYKHIQSDMQQHRQLISQIVTTGILIGATIATGGGALALGLGVGANLAFGSFMIASGAQEDKEIAQTQEEIQKYLDTYTIWTQNQTVITAGMQDALTEEIQQQLNSELTNKNIGLGFSENFFNTLLTGFRAQEAYVLGAYQLTQVLAPDSNNLLIGDVGSLFGYQTNWLNLNPSQGLTLYAPSRGHIAQEIAQAPALFNVGTATDGRPIQQAYFWFLQSITRNSSNTSDQSVTFEVRLRPLYLLDSYSVGIGIGGSSFNPQAVQQTQQADPDRFSLMKMFVTQQSSDAAPTLGVYEHESPIAGANQGWLTTDLGKLALTPGNWYHFKATLSGSSLAVQAWQEGSNPPEAQTIPVTALSSGQQVPLTVIFSGASLEFDVLTPQEAGSFTNKVYPTDNPAGTEAQRQTTRSLLYSQIKNPIFPAQSSNNWNLTAASLYDILKGNYVYTTQANQLGQPDYILFCQLTGSSNSSSTTIGISPSSITQNSDTAYGVVSLVSGALFDAGGTRIGTQANVWNLYQQTVGSSLTTSLTKAILAARQTYNQKLAQPFTFGSFTLTPSSISDMTAGQYVYTTTTASGFTDYVVLAALDQNNTIQQFGMPYDASNNSSNAFVSLVTYQIYTSANRNPLPNRSLTNIENLFKKSYGLSASLAASIAAAQSSYQKQIAAKSPTQAQQISVPEVPDPTVATTGGAAASTTVPTLGTQTVASLTTQQEAASSSDTGW